MSCCECRECRCLVVGGDGVTVGGHGQIGDPYLVSAVPWPPSVTAEDPTNQSFSVTAPPFPDFGLDGDGNPVCVVFIAPPSGRELIEFAARVDNSDPQTTLVAPAVREGAAPGQGTVVHEAYVRGSVGRSTGGEGSPVAGSHILLEGLTPGAEYNVCLEHTVTDGTTGTIWYRRVSAVPVP